MVAENPPKRRRRSPRIEDNPMAVLAQEVVTAAKGVFDTADELAAAMKPHLLQQVSNSKIYQYTTRNKERKRNVPPGDVLLAAALVAGISIDEQLGLIRQASEIDILRAQFAEMREEMASLRAALAGQAGPPVEDPANEDDAASAEVRRAFQRKAWAQGSKADAGGQRSEPTPGSRRTGRAGRR
jgi:hypothetical protein